MNPFDLPDDILEDMTQIFQIEREGRIVYSAHGFFCGRDYPHTIQIVEKVAIKNGDWLIDSITSQRYFAKDARPISSSDWLVEYQTELDYKKSQEPAFSSVFNVQTVHGSAVFGNQNQVTFNFGNNLNDIADLIKKLPPADQAEAEELFKTLESTENAAHPVLVEGCLSKFSKLLQKHSDLLIAVGGWAVQLLIGK